MQVQKKNHRKPNSLTVIQLINQHSDLAQFFNKYATESSYEDLAVKLLRNAIGLNHPKEKHYNVAYVKHHRFLSPSQKREVTPKVTEVIPLPPNPPKIYGKPKVKLDDQNCQIQQQEPYIPKYQIVEPQQSQTDLQRLIPQKEQLNKNQIEIQSQKYLSPKTKYNKKPFKNQVSRERELKKQKLKQTGRTTKQELKIDSNFRTTMKQSKTKQIQSPKYSRQKQNYGNIQSRIKFLIDKDKKDCLLQRQLEEQNQVIQQLQQRQEKLLMRQYQQSKNLSQVKSQPQLSCCCESDDQIEAKLMKLKANRVSATYQNTIQNIKSRLSPANTYKISSKEIYPLSSSSEDEQYSSDDIVVAPLY